MTESVGTIRIHSGGVAEPDGVTITLAETTREIEQARRAGFAEIEWDEVEMRGHYLALPDGSLWKRERGEPASGRSRRDFRYAITSPPQGPAVGIAWYRRTVSPEPETVAELDERERRNQKAAEAQKAERAKRIEWARKTAEPITVADKTLPPTLRAMVECILNLGGKVEFISGRVVVFLPPYAQGNGMGQVGSRVAAQLYRAEAELLATRKGDGPINVAKVPDRPLLPSGRVLP